MTTPRSSAIRRRPRASSAGCTVAPSRMKRAVAEARGGAARLDLVRAERHELLGHAQPLRHRHGAERPVVVRGGGGDDQHAGLAVSGVDAVLLAPRPDRSHRLRHGARRGQRRLGAVQLFQRVELIPPGIHEAAVAPGRAAAADVLLEQDDLPLRRALLQVERCPQPRVAAAHDGDIAGAVPQRARQGRRIAFGRQRLAQPWAAHARDRVGGRGPQR